MPAQFPSTLASSVNDVLKIVAHMTILPIGSRCDSRSYQGRGLAGLIFNLTQLPMF